MDWCKTLLISILVFGFSCSDEEEKELALEGTYTGIFFRSINETEEITANIILTFDDNNFSGSSDIEKYPAICHGKYKIENDHIVRFINGCAWTADFDWTLILDGSFKLSETSSYIYLVEELSDGVKNTYRLNK